MAFVGKTFDYQSVTAGDDGYLYDILSGQQNFMFSVGGGNPFTISNNVLTIAQCYMLISGRAIRVEANTTISLGTIPTSATKGRVIIRLDMSKLATETTFRQIETEVETTSGSYRALVQQNINSINGQSGNKYEAVMCEFTCSSGTASAPTRSLTGNPFPLPIAKGGTGATAKGNAFLNISSMEYATATDFNNIRLPGVYAINPSTTPTNHPTGANDSGQLFVIGANQNYTGEWSMTLQIFTKLFGDGIYVRSYANQSWRPWHKMKNDVPDIVQFYISKSSYSHFGYANLQITTRTNISGDTSFTSANTDYWNIQLNPGTYRMNLYCSFQSSSAVTTDVGIGLGNNANRRATPIEARVQTTGSLTKLNASGILKVTSYNDLYSFLIYMGDTTARDIGGYWTIERIGQ